MKLWLIIHHHPHAATASTVRLLPSHHQPTEAEAIRTFKFQVEPEEDESIHIEYTGYQLAPLCADLRKTTREALAHSEKGDLAAATQAIRQLDLALEDAVRVNPRTFIMVCAGIVTDVFSTERTMDVAILDIQDVKAIGPTVATVDAGIIGLHRIL